MTYLELVNKVLRRLRERSITAITADYSLLVGDIVNEAKEDVERAWKWKARRINITFPTVANQQDYNIGTGGVASTATNERSQLMYAPMSDLPQAFNLTGSYKGDRLIEVAREGHRQEIADDNATNTAPSRFSLTKSATGYTASIYPRPDGVYSIQMTWYIPQAALATDVTVLAIPEDPVWRLALAYASSERGEGAGAATERYESRAKIALAEAISREADDAELTFYEA